ncbi:RUN/FYVE domain-containing protein [Citrus sinensis]|uniref:RUN/FYVE domain-containing protein n=1 Tax=Citrus sinensis TaxID=2711 RepID=A0ACB8LJT7_CITSI|nr:RUN/FYVE domain-containing protein [Citrus sinensis]
MELLRLSKFKFQLQALIAETRHLKKQKRNEEEYSRNLKELQSELASTNELCQKLERKVSYLQNDNALLENKQKELKETINRLLQYRENFLSAYEESTCDMKRAIETRDRKLTVLHEKINSHLTLFDSIEKEAFSIKQVVDNVECVDNNAFHTALMLKENCNDIGTVNEDTRWLDRVKDANHNGGERSPSKASSLTAPENRASPLCQKHIALGSQFRENNNFSSCVPELAGSLQDPESDSSEQQSSTNILMSISAKDVKDTCVVSAHHPDSECSMTQAETSKESRLNSNAAFQFHF